MAALAGCGSDDGDEGAAPATSGGGGGEINITARDFSFEPDDLKVDTAGTVVFHVTNEGSVEHVLEVEGGDVEEETKHIKPGDTLDLTVDLVDGNYEIYCPLFDHKEKGMEGELVVGAGSPGGTTTDDDEDEDEGGTTTDDDSGYGG